MKNVVILQKNQSECSIGLAGICTIDGRRNTGHRFDPNLIDGRTFVTDRDDRRKVSVVRFNWKIPKGQRRASSDVLPGLVSTRFDVKICEEEEKWTRGTVDGEEILTKGRRKNETHCLRVNRSTHDIIRLSSTWKLRNWIFDWYSSRNVFDCFINLLRDSTHHQGNGRTTKDKGCEGVLSCRARKQLVLLRKLFSASSMRWREKAAKEEDHTWW